MKEFFLHFFICLVGSGTIFLILSRYSTAASNSAPFGLVFFALACGVLAIYLSPWLTPAALLVYAVVGLKELRDEQRDARNASILSADDD